MRWFLFLLLLLPAMEIGVFLWIGGKIGPWWVVLFILLTGIIGVSIARFQGMETWRKANDQIRQGKVPTENIIDGICILLGGIFLLAPGFITDTIGFIFVLPFTRKPMKRLLYNTIKRKVSNGTIIYRKW